MPSSLFYGIVGLAYVQEGVLIVVDTSRERMNGIRENARIYCIIENLLRIHGSASKIPQDAADEAMRPFGESSDLVYKTARLIERRNQKLH